MSAVQFLNIDAIGAVALTTAASLALAVDSCAGMSAAAVAPGGDNEKRSLHCRPPLSIACLP